MITISQVVNSIIEQKPFLAETLVDGIINISSLARQIQPEIEARLQKPVQTGAIIMALKRYAPQIDITTNAKLKRVFFDLGDIIVRSNLSDFTFKNSESLFGRHIKLLKIISEKKEIFYTFVQGVFESTLVISSTLYEEVVSIFKEERLLNQSRQLSSITLKLPLENIQLPGFYYFILRKIAWEGINIVEVVSTTNEFTVVVRDEDVEKTFSVLKSLKK